MRVLRDTIPTWRAIIADCGIRMDDIINSNSYFRSDASLIGTDGKTLNGRQREDTFVMFELQSDKFILNENENGQSKTLIEGKLILDIYGELAHDAGIKIYSKLFQPDTLLKLIESGIGLNPDISINNLYETIYGVQWNKTNMEIKFTYEHKWEQESEQITEISLIRMKGI